MTTCIVPHEWKIAEARSLFKKMRITRMLTQRTQIKAKVLPKEQNRLRKGRFCTDSVLTPKLLIEKRHEFNSQIHITFVNYIKALEKVNQNYCGT